MGCHSLILVASVFSAFTSAQQIGKAVPEHHPKLPTSVCTVKGGCVKQQTQVVLDAFSRNIHKINDTSVSCGNSGYLDPTLCGDATSCAANCALEGIDYAAHGLQTKGDALILNQFIKGADGNYSVVSPRAYLVDPNGKDYESYKMLAREISFDVDVSKLVCGMNGALYFSEMNKTGGRSELNPAGAAYGTGYCDAQCPKLAWIDGVANVNETYGACCNEMDLWEANALAQAYTPHACNITGVYKCSSADECGQDHGVCDEWGCGYNPYSYGIHDYYGRNLTVNTNRKFTVVTQFLTDDGKPTGTLTEIRRLYVQDGRVIKNAAVSAGGQTVDSITDSYCNATASWFQARGGLADMGGALERGMVLIFSIWADSGGFMNWLDSGSSGPCNDTEGNPVLIQQEHPDAAVTFSNIKYGELNSTYTAKYR